MASVLGFLVVAAIVIVLAVIAIKILIALLPVLLVIGGICLVVFIVSGASDDANGVKKEIVYTQNTVREHVVQFRDDVQRDYHEQRENTRGNDEVDARAAAAQEAERRAVIVHVHETQDAGNELDDIGAEQGVLDPVLHCLIQNDDKQADY